MFTTWAPYALVGAGATGIWLMQSAFNSGPLQLSLPAIAAGEPLVGILLGILVFGDRIQITPGELALQAGGIVALILGVIVVGRAPALSQLRRLTPATLPHITGSLPHITSGLPSLPSLPSLPGIHGLGGRHPAGEDDLARADDPRPNGNSRHASEGRHASEDPRASEDRPAGEAGQAGDARSVRDSRMNGHAAADPARAKDGKPADHPNP
jgi:hypothetical protein